MSKAKKWILVGDDRQLPPMVNLQLHTREVREKYGLLADTVDRTLFTYLRSEMPVENVFQLDHQYRMIDPIGNLISHCFYENRLKSQHRQRLPVLDRILPPVLWLNTSSQIPQKYEKRTGTTFLNWYEAQLVINQLEVFAGSHLRGVMDFKDISILITAPYSAQIRQIERMVEEHKSDFLNLDISIKTIDQVQGREADITILSLTRSNEEKEVGFLSEPSRINVALSRAKHGLIIIGDCDNFKESRTALKSVISYMQANVNSCEIRSTDA